MYTCSRLVWQVSSRAAHAARCCSPPRCLYVQHPFIGTSRSRARRCGQRFTDIVGDNSYMALLGSAEKSLLLANSYMAPVAFTCLALSAMGDMMVVTSVAVNRKTAPEPILRLASFALADAVYAIATILQLSSYFTRYDNDLASFDRPLIIIILTASSVSLAWLVAYAHTLHRLLVPRKGGAMLNPAVYHVLCWGFGIALGVVEGLHHRTWEGMNMVVLSIDPLPGSSKELTRNLSSSLAYL